MHQQREDSKWSMTHSWTLTSAVWCILVLLASAVDAVTTQPQGTGGPATTLMSDGETSAPPATESSTLITSMPPTYRPSTLNSDTTLPLESTEAGTRRPPSSAIALMTGSQYNATTDARGLSTAQTPSNQEVTSKMGPSAEQTSPITDDAKTGGGTKRSTEGFSTIEDIRDVMTSDMVSMVTMSGGSSMTLTIIEWFLVAVAIAAFLFFIFLCYHCCKASRKRAALGQDDHHKNFIEYATPTSPKEKWRNSWALEAMIYHIELPQETDAEMEAKDNPGFEGEETDAATNSHPATHLTKV